MFTPGVWKKDRHKPSQWERSCQSASCSKSDKLWEVWEGASYIVCDIFKKVRDGIKEDGFVHVTTQIHHRWKMLTVKMAQIEVKAGFTDLNTFFFVRLAQNHVMLLLFLHPNLILALAAC